MLRWVAANSTTMDDRDVRAIIDTALRIVQRVPMTIDGTDEFFAYLCDFGCAIDGTKVHFPQSVIDQAMERCARYKQDHAQSLPDPARQITFATSGQALFIAETGNDRLRRCTCEDLATYCRVNDAIPGLGRSHPGFIPQDVPLKTQELHAFAVIVLNSRTPHRVSLYSPQVLPYYLNILEVVCGDREATAARARELHPSKVWCNTPMMISRENIETPMLLRELTGQPLEFSLMPVAGAATPVTPAGALALITAEVIAVNILSLAVDDRIVGWGSSPLFFDMKSANHTDFGPETQLLHLGAFHLRRELFGIESVPAVPLSTAAKEPGAQSMMERARQIAYAYALGSRNFGSLGTLATSDVVSTVQLMLDLEMVSSFTLAAAGFDVDAEALAEQVIIDVAPTGARFLDTDHTFEHYRRVSWFPEFLDRRAPMAWNDHPTDIVETARAKSLQLEQTAQNQCPLNDEQRHAILSIMKEADRKLG